GKHTEERAMKERGTRRNIHTDTPPTHTHTQIAIHVCLSFFFFSLLFFSSLCVLFGKEVGRHRKLLQLPPRTHTHTHAHAHTHTRTHAHTHAHTHARGVHTRKRTRTHTTHTQTHTHTHTYAHMCKVHPSPLSKCNITGSETALR